MYIHVTALLAHSFPGAGYRLTFETVCCRTSLISRALSSSSSVLPLSAVGGWGKVKNSNNVSIT